VRELIRRNLTFFLFASLAAVILRTFFIVRFPSVVNDSFVYGDIAKNWLQHGIYGLSGPDEISHTYIRLPGYPAFLAFVFAVFGVDHYGAVLIVQACADFATCILCADMARRLLGPHAAKLAFVLAAICPFLADYAAAALAETLEVFFTALALDFVIAAFQNNKQLTWAGAGAACAAAILFRPDGVLLLVSIEAYLIFSITFKHGATPKLSQFRAPTIVLVLSIAPLVPWALRNWRTFHRFQPLAPRYANEENEFVPMGFNRWVKTWIGDYTSVEEVYWQVPGSKIDPMQLPSRAVDTPAQQIVTTAAINAYNTELHVTPELDKKFATLADQRIRAHPVRYYIELPLIRILDMWVRPRTEMLPCDSRWWEFNDEPKWSALAVSFGALSLAYLICALVGWLRSRMLSLTGLLVLFLILRSAFLGTLENPEPRYTLEMYPVVVVFAAAALVKAARRDMSTPVTH
jgi:4-amino-4-deoxy-L-arabinose transferase-like glycosyltransferase